MKVRLRYQAFLAIDNKGPRIFDGGTVLELPDDFKLGKWAEVIEGKPATATTPVPAGKPKPAEVISEPKPRQVKQTDLEVL